MRLFNLLPLRWGAPVWRLLAWTGDFELHNPRRHDKLFLAGNAVAIFDARNIADECFMGHAEANFIDMDLLTTGAVVQGLSALFDRYGNSDAAWPVQALLGGPAGAGRSAEAAPNAAAEAPARFDTAVRDAAPVIPAHRTDPLGQTAVQARLDQGRLALHCASASVFADSPAQVSTPAGMAPTESLSFMPAHHAQKRPLVVANARHSPGYGCAFRLDRTPLDALYGRARKTLRL